jgi:hypothetical protein
VPVHEVPKLVAPGEIAGDAELDMMALAQMESANELVASLSHLVDEYERWITARRSEAASPAIAKNKRLREAAELQLRSCARAAERMREGLRLLQDDPVSYKAFRYANLVMADQRVHALWASEKRAKGKDARPLDAFRTPDNHTWRPFQLGFIMLNLRGVADPGHPDRDLVDLLWFPTGGGKTEAYLGLTAFSLFTRRLKGDRDGMEAGAGVSVLMRYTLRLLTVQQFQRAAALIAACDVHRRAHVDELGTEPFRVGLWVGMRTTPNRFKDSHKALQELAKRGYTTETSPVQLMTCPRCGAELADEKGIPQQNSYRADTKKSRTFVFCPAVACELNERKSKGEGIPVVVVDEELYRLCPSLVIATVDKFARMPFVGETQTLFGLRKWYSPTYGHLAACTERKVGPKGTVATDAKPAVRLLPPELIIQDELHLISGPLGTMVGLYEAAIDFLTQASAGNGAKLRPKIIASTATIRRAEQQVRQLYNRELRIFPPSALSSKDSFFAREVPVDEHDRNAGRVYVGLNAPGSSSKTLLVRVYSALLHAGVAELDESAEVADPYLTLVGYFNSMKALGGAKRLVEDDVRLRRLFYLANRQMSELGLAKDDRKGFKRRLSDDAPQELTSRLKSHEIPSLLKRLDLAFSQDQKGGRPVDVLLATNMISVGVDIDRLGLMVVTGQPKTTAEYIQATSRVGRRHPGLVATMYNWNNARDMSHYERFQAYHAALYRYVEPISVTPFSSRSLDRGLAGVYVSTQRLLQDDASGETDAGKFDANAVAATQALEHLVKRAVVGGAGTSDRVRDRLEACRDDWATMTGSSACYSRRPRSAAGIPMPMLLAAAGGPGVGRWKTPSSLREVEPTAAFFLLDEIGESK